MATKEKFEEAKRLYETANADQRYVLESLFPELKESEDERVRKEIISAIKEDWPGHTDWIAWIEKQAQKPTDKVEPKFKIGDEIIKRSKSSCSVHSSTDDTICKVAEIHDTCYILDTKEGKVQEPFEWQDYYELVEQNPTDKVEPIVVRDFNSVFSREQVEEIDKRIEESQRLYNAKLRDAMQKIEDFPMTD